MSIRMRKNTEIRLERLFQCLFRNNTAFVFRNSFMQFPQNSLFSFSPQQAMVWENNIAEKIYAPVQFADTNFSGMKFQSQPIVQNFLIGSIRFSRKVLLSEIITKSSV